MKKDEKYSRILEAAETVFFRHGFEKASMDQIAREAQVAKGTLYLYFQSKQHLYYAIGARALSLLLSSSQETTKNCTNGLSKVVAFGRNFAHYRKTYPNYYRFIVDYQGERYDEVNSEGEIHRTYQESRELFQFLVDAVAEGQKDGSIKVQMPHGLLATLLWCQTCGVVQLADLRESFFQLFSPSTADEIVNAYFECTREVLSVDRE